MSNAPEKITIDPESDQRLYWEFEADGMTPYTRTDTIPSRAEVAQEFRGEVDELYESGDYTSMTDAIDAVVKRWEAQDATEE